LTAALLALPIQFAGSTERSWNLSCRSITATTALVGTAPVTRGLR
jgi:hypothetical protein